MESGDGDASFFDLMSTRTKVVLIGVGVLGAVLALKPLVWLEAWPVLLLGAAAFLIAERREKAAQQAMVAQARARMAERAGRRGRGVCGGAAGAAGAWRVVVLIHVRNAAGRIAQHNEFLQKATQMKVAS